MVIIENPSVTVNCRTTMKVLCLSINFCLSEKMDSLSHLCRSKSFLTTLDDQFDFQDDPGDGSEHQCS